MEIPVLFFPSIQTELVGVGRKHIPEERKRRERAQRRALWSEARDLEGHGVEDQSKKSS